MSECILSDQERKDFHELQVRAANLRLKKIDSEKEFIESIGKEYSEAECKEIEKKRRRILHELELEGAKIELEYVEKYRSKLFRISGGRLGGVSGGGVFESCIICEKCVTAQCLNCVACASCVTWVSAF